MRHPWPRLSETLANPLFPPSPDQCQACGRFADRVEHWQEHDDRDRPEPIVVTLCRHCSDRLIEKHPRLYRRLERNEPFPGVMGLRRDCLHRQGNACKHPDPKALGGEGLLITYSRPTPMRIDYTARGGGRRGTTLMIYGRPPSDCAGREGAPTLIFPAAGESPAPAIALGLGSKCAGVAAMAGVVEHWPLFAVVGLAAIAVGLVLLARRPPPSSGNDDGQDEEDFDVKAWRMASRRPAHPGRDRHLRINLSLCHPQLRRRRR